MTAEIIQGQYDQLEQVARQFARQADAMVQLQRQVTKVLQALQSGGWQGKGSAAFFAEMNGKVLPVVGRLHGALQQGRTVTTEISTLVKQAEAEAASVFRGSALGTVPAGDGAVVAGGNGAGFAADPNLLAQLGNGLAFAAPSHAELEQRAKSVFQPAYMKGLIGLHPRGEDLPETNQLMEKLLQNPQGPELQRTLDRLADIRGVPREEFRAQYDKFLAVRSQAEALNGQTDAIDLSKHGDFLGSTASLRYGKVVGDVFGIDPVFGALLNPTGGMVGAGNTAYNPGDDSPVGYHGIVHDAAGYLYNYHNLGPGYNYLGSEVNRHTSDPLTGQRSGLQWWLQQTELDPIGPDFILEDPDVGRKLGNAYDKTMAGAAVAAGAVRISVDAVTGLGKTAVEAVKETGDAVVGGVKRVGQWLGF